MIYLLKTPDGKEIKNTIDARTRDAAERYFASLMHLELEVLLKLYLVQKKYQIKLNHKNMYN